MRKSTAESAYGTVESMEPASRKPFWDYFRAGRPAHGSEGTGNQTAMIWTEKKNMDWPWYHRLAKRWPLLPENFRILRPQVTLYRGITPTSTPVGREEGEEVTGYGYDPHYSFTIYSDYDSQSASSPYSSYSDEGSFYSHHRSNHHTTNKKHEERGYRCGPLGLLTPQKWIVMFLITIAVLAILASVAYGIYFAVCGKSGCASAEMNNTVIIDGGIELTALVFSNKLLNPTSNTYTNLSRDVCSNLDSIVARGNYSENYRDCQIVEFQNGSVIVLFELTFQFAGAIIIEEENALAQQTKSDIESETYLKSGAFKQYLTAGDVVIVLWIQVKDKEKRKKYRLRL